MPTSSFEKLSVIQSLQVVVEIRQADGEPP